ncbi:MAG TPA: hypothetical protein VFV93_03880, partial [Thermomicrobiales bacterium]|nr:hypothetical protein [Thermomicrobiales bacterium]
MAALSESLATARLGEVIETNTTGFAAESDQLHRLPELGALVCVGGLEETRSYYGVVSFGETGGLDTSRKAVRRGGDHLQDEAIYDRHPELDMVLRTIFEVAVIGYGDGPGYRHTLPALPVPLHYSVHGCDRTTTAAFTANPRDLASLLSFHGEIMPEQLLAAHLRWVDRQLNDDQAWLADATRRLARLMKRDYDRLSMILEAVAPD